MDRDRQTEDKPTYRHTGRLVIKGTDSLVFFVAISCRCASAQHTKSYTKFSKFSDVSKIIHGTKNLTQMPAWLFVGGIKQD